MANNPQSSGAQPLRPPAVASMGPQNFGPPLSMQFRPAVPGQHGNPYIPAASQQFRPIGQNLSSPNVGVPSGQNQLPQFSQAMQQFPPRPNQPGPITPSSQPIPMPYIQPNRPLTLGSPQSHQTAPPLNSHMPGLAGPGMHFSSSSSYTFAPASFGQPQSTVNASAQFQPISQMHAPVGGQPWLSSGSQSGALVTPVHQAGQQPSVTADVPALNVPNPTHQSLSDWQEHTSADGRRYYYNKKTRLSSWEKPLELMTPIEMSWQVRRI